MNNGEQFKNVEVVDYSFQGMGVVKLNNFTIFVPRVKVGETIDIELTDVKKNYGFGKVISERSDSYQCPHYETCGGCNTMHMSNEESNEFKNGILNMQLEKNLVKTSVQPFAAAKKDTGYRNKIAMPVHYTGGKLRLGYYAPSSHKLTPIDNCLLANDKINKLIAPIEQLLNDAGERAYNYKIRKGNIRHVVIRGDEQIQVVLVTASGKLANEKQIVEALLALGVTSVGISQNKNKGRVILGPKTKIIGGAKDITLKLGDKNFAVGPNAFFQVNIDTAEMILDYIKTLVDFKQKNVLDAFCGTGTLGISLADSAKSIIGIDIERDAIQSAKQNVRSLGIANAKYKCADIEQAVTELDLAADVIIVDPPRSGLATEMKHFLITQHPAEIIYVSCDPTTLSRDLSELAVHYEVESVKGFDMFPQTYHIEAVAHLTLRKEK